MLALFTKGWRKTLGALVVALYAICVMLPTAAVAASHSPVSEHCLGEHHHGLADHQHTADAPAIHDHAGATHDEPADHDHGQSGKCCGLFGVTALAPDFQVVVIEQTQSSDVTMPRVTNLLGSRGDRIDRPPRNVLSL